MAECSSDLQAEKLRMIPREKMKTLISKLCEVKCEDVYSYMYRNVGSGYHLKHYPERQIFWDACIQTKALDSFVNAFFDEYLVLVDGLKGHEKYTSLQVQ